jgi:uncharacterized membrane protein
MTDRLYRPVLGPILADQPDMQAAVAFYLISIFGTVFLAIAPALRNGAASRIGRMVRCSAICAVTPLLVKSVAKA